MQSRTLATNQAAIGFSTTGDGGPGNPATAKVSDCGYPTGNLQISAVGGSTFSVSIFGRANPGMPFIQLSAAITAAGVSSITLLPEMYSQVTANATGAVINVAIAYPIAGR
jgi:hypothetical protein